MIIKGIKDDHTLSWFSMSKLKFYLVNDSLNLFLLVSTAENLKKETQVKSDNILIQTSCHSDSMPERYFGEIGK